MKKPAILLFVVILFIELLCIPTASAGNVSVSFSGEKNVKPGQTYTYSYTVYMNDCYEIQTGFLCSNASLSGDTKVSYTNSTIGNTNFSTSGVLSLKIDESTKTDDTIKITTNGRFSIVNDEGIPNLGGYISDAYTLTVVSDEATTPIPTTAPSEPVPSETVIVAPSPAPEPEATPTSKPASHPSTKPSCSTSDPKPSPEYTPSQSRGLLTSTDISQPTNSNDFNSLSSQLDLMPKGGTVAVSMDPFNENSLSALTLRVLKAKQGKMIIDFNSYSCTIDGNKLASTDNPVNLYVDMTINQKISDVAEGYDLYQLHFSEKGDFPGCLVYEIPAVKNQPGDVLYLYQYHGTSGINEYKQSIKVDDNGHASLELYEGGSYFISTSLIDDNPKTGDDPVQKSADSDLLYLIIPISCVILSAAVILAALIIRKAANSQQSLNK